MNPTVLFDNMSMELNDQHESPEANHAFFGTAPVKE
jgi:hypothetical protein